SDPSLNPEPPPLYSAACRLTKRENEWLLETWAQPLVLGRPLPTVPLWLAHNLSVPLEVGGSYEQSCGIPNIPLPRDQTGLFFPEGQFHVFDLIVQAAEWKGPACGCQAGPEELPAGLRVAGAARRSQRSADPFGPAGSVDPGGRGCGPGHRGSDRHPAR